MIDVVGVGSRVPGRAGRDAGRHKGAANGVFPSSAPSPSSSSPAGHVAIAAAAPVALLAGARAAGVAAASRHAAFGLDAWHLKCGLAVVCIWSAHFFTALCIANKRRNVAGPPEPDVEAGGVLGREEARE